MTANIRFIFDNAADRATLTASSTAGTLAATNLQSDEQAAVWRSAAGVTTATLTLLWSTPEEIDSIALAWTNFSPHATVRVRAWEYQTDATDDTLVDTTVTPDAVDATTTATGAYTNGAIRAGVPQSAQVWLATAVVARKAIITLTDTGSADGYLEASRLIVGARFEPAINAEDGLEVTVIDRAKPVRAESGDLRTEPLTRNRSVSCNLLTISDVAERNALVKMAQGGLGTGVWISCFPDWTDASDQQWGAFYAGSVRDAGFTFNPMYNWRESLQFEELGESSTAAPAVTVLQEYAWAADLITAITRSVGGGTETFTAASTRYQADFEGKCNAVKSGEARIQGGRRVENLLSRSPVDSSTLSDWTGALSVLTGISDPLAGTTAETLVKTAGSTDRYTTWTYPVGSTIRNSIWMRRRTGSGQVTLRDTNNAVPLDVTGLITAEWQHVTTDAIALTSGIPLFGVSIYTDGDAVDVWHPQPEDVSGKTNTAPADYVQSNGTHGVGTAVGVEYASTLNGNSVASNIVTHTTGAAISEATLLGLVSEPSQANLIGVTDAIVRLMSDAGWVISNGTDITVTTTTGIDGVSTTAARLTATANNATILFTPGLGSAARTYAPYLKRITGAGAISTTVDGAAFTAQTLTASYPSQPQALTATAVPVVGIKMAISGDVIDVDFNQLVAGSIAPAMPIPVNVTTAADVHSQTTSGHISAAATTVQGRLTPLSTLGSTVVFHWGTWVDVDNYTAVLSDGTNLIARKRIAAANHDATIAWTRTVGTTIKFMAVFDGSFGIRIFKDGTKGTSDTTTTAAQIAATMQVGADGNGANQDYCGHKYFKTWAAAVADKYCEIATT